MALDGHASSKKMCKPYLKVRCLSMLKVCGSREVKVDHCALAFWPFHTILLFFIRSIVDLKDYKRIAKFRVFEQRDIHDLTPFHSFRKFSFCRVAAFTTPS